MQFLVIGRDGTDPEAPARRLKAREDHLANVRKLKTDGNLITAGAILDDAGSMIGSAILCDFPNRAAVDAWLKNDPYVTENVWQKTEIAPFRQAKFD